MTEPRPEGQTPKRYIQIDEEGYFQMESLRVADADAGKDWLSQVHLDSHGRAWTTISGESVFVEAFDEPFIALDVERGPELWSVTMPYGHREIFRLESLTLDEWDRFHGRTERGIPFVFSRPAQARFFNLVDEFDDDAITVDGKRFETTPWLKDNPDANQSAWWTNIYRTETPRWDLGGPSPILSSLVPQLKLQKSRILVLGAGQGHDAAWFAQQGHLVTAIDFSEEAVSRAKARYSHLTNLNFIQADVFNLPSQMNGSFDIVFEHTLYCAIVPSRRRDLFKVWRRVLTDDGHLLGIFETRDKTWGPPYGGSEWEVRSRIQKGFRPLYWMRFRDSVESRVGREFFVYAQRLPTF